MLCTQTALLMFTRFASSFHSVLRRYVCVNICLRRVECVSPSLRRRRRRAGSVFVRRATNASPSQTAHSTTRQRRHIIHSQPESPIHGGAHRVSAPRQIIATLHCKFVQNFQSHRVASSVGTVVRLAGWCTTSCVQ